MFPLNINTQKQKKKNVCWFLKKMVERLNNIWKYIFANLKLTLCRTLLELVHEELSVLLM